MAELPQALRARGAELATPPPPARPGGARRPAAQPAPPRLDFRSRRVLVVALAALAIVAGVMAVPQARSAILDFFGIGGVTVVQVDELPQVDAPPLDLGRRVSLDEAERQAGFEVLEPELDDPDAVYVRQGPTGVQVGFRWGPETRPRLLLTQHRGRVGLEFARKVVGEGTRVEQLEVDGSPALWLSGKPHLFYYLDEAGEPHEQELALAGNTLLWAKGPLTLRLEGDLTRAEAVEIAQSVG
jgi:hypothetical protein